jgi:photosystem II stability/assembly factor-like uncharacterized protein
MSRSEQRPSSPWKHTRQAALAIATIATIGVGAFGAAPPLAAGTNFWTAVGPSGGLAFTVLVDPVDPRVVYAGTFGGVFKSTTGGASWQAASRGMTVHPVVALAIDPLHHRTVYAAAGVETAGSGVWVTRDGAATWETVLLVDNNSRSVTKKEFLTSLAVDPAHPGAVYAASNFHLFVSRDAGSTWKVGQDFSAVDPDWGLSVRLAADPNRASVFALAAATFVDSQPYFKLLESSDGGTSWRDRSAALPDGQRFNLFSLAIEPTAPGTLYLAGSAVFRSRDGAASWQRVGPSWQFEGAFLPPLAAGPHGFVIVGNSDDPVAFKSLDGGTTWAPFSGLPIDSGESVRGYAVGASPEQIYAAVEGVGVIASGDGGATWQAANRGLRAMRAFAAAIDPQNPNAVFTVGDTDFALGVPGLFHSSNAGGSWLPIGPRQFPANLWVSFVASGHYYFNPNTLFVDPAQPTHLVYGSGDEAARSMDGGASWAPIPAPEASCQPFFFLSQEPSSPSTLYSTASGCQSGCGAFKTVDDGATWSCVGAENVYRIVVAPSDPNVLYAVHSIFTPRPPKHLLWKSADAGTTWAPIDSQLPLTSPLLVDHPYLAVDPGNAQRIFVGVPQGVWRSNDGGGHWSEQDHGLPHGAPDHGFPFSPLLAVDPNNPDLVYAAAPDIGVYRSRDSGSHWQPILAGLPPLNPVIGGPNFYLALVPDPQDSGTVYLGTYDNGLLVYSAR